jgi:hypothetical protein
VWTTNFLGLYAKDDDAAKPDENARLLCVHLKQRFAELRALMIRKGGGAVSPTRRSFLPTFRTASRGRAAHVQQRFARPAW